MRHRLIVLIDFSPHSEVLLAAAYGLAAERDGALLLLHQFKEPTPGFADSEMVTSLKEATVSRYKERLHAFASGLLPHTAGIRYETVMQDLAESLEELREEGAADVLFVGLKDKSMIDQLMLGSTGVYLANEADHIIVGLPEGIEEMSLEHLHIAVKKSFPLNEAALDQVLDLGKNRIRSLHFFSTLAPGEADPVLEAYLARLAATYNQRVPAIFSVRHAESAFTGIREFLTTQQGTLILQRGSRSFGDIFRKFFVTEMVHFAHIPLIVLP